MAHATRYAQVIRHSPKDALKLNFEKPFFFSFLFYKKSCFREKKFKISVSEYSE